MSTARRFLLYLTLVFLAPTLNLLSAKAQDERDPVTLGKPLSVWVKELKSKDSATRQTALRALGTAGLKTKGAVGPITKLLADPYPDVVEQAAQTLGQIGPEAKEAVVPLVKVLTYDWRFWYARKAAAEAITRIGSVPKEAIPELIKIVQDKESKYRLFALDILRRMGPQAQDAVAILVKLASEESDVDLQRAIREALGQMGPPEALAKLPSSRAGDDQNPISEGQPLSVWIQELKAVYPANRQMALRAIGALGPKAKRAVGPVMKLLEDSQPGVIERAAKTLGQIGPDAREAAVPLVKLVNYPDSWVRKEAQEALLRLGPGAKAAVPDLIQIARDQKSKYRLWALDVLGGMGAEAKAAEPHLMNLVSEDSDLDIRMAAAQALIRINPQNAVPALVPLLRPEDRLLRVETKEVAVLPGATCPVTYSPDGKLLVSGAAGEIKLWDSGTWKEQGTLGKGSTPAVFSPDGKFLAASGKGEVKVWEVKTGKHLATLVVRGTEYFVPLVFSADGKALATVSLKYEEGLSPYTVELKLWDLTSGKERAAPKPEDAPETIPVILRLASQGFLASTFLMDVQILCRDSRIDPCAIAEGRVQATLSVVGARSGIIDEASSLDGKVLAKVSARAGWLGTIPDDKVQLLDMVRGRDLVLEGHHQGILALAFSRDGKLLSSGDKNGTVILWDVASGRKLGVIEGPQGQKTEGGRPNWEPGSNSFFGNYLAFSPDGERLLLGGTWKGIKVWRIIPVDLLHDMKQK